MKKSSCLALSLCTLLTSAAPVFAEESLVPGVHVASEPVGNTYEVSFTYQDKDDKDAVKVTVGGNMQWYKTSDPVVKDFENTGVGTGARIYSAAEYKPGMFNTGSGLNDDLIWYEMSEPSDEVFTITLNLPGNLYYYDYTVTYDDGSTITIQDPANPSKKNPSNDHDSSHSLVLVGDSTHTARGQEAIYPTTGAKGSYSFVSYSAVDGTKQPLGVYLPAGYDSSKTYPTMYVSHGGGGNEAEWMDIGAVPNIMDNMINQNEIVPTVVVTMDHSYFGWKYDQIAQNFKEHIIPYIEEHYSVSTERDHRAMCGLSMGSMTTSTMMLTYPELFGYYGAFSGANVPAEVTNLALLKDSTIYITAGNVDMAIMNDSYLGDSDRTTKGLLNKLDKLGVSYSYDVKLGAHDWAVWRDALTTFVRDYAFNKLEKDEPAAPATGWIKNTDGSWSYAKKDGSLASGWVNDGGRWYHIAANGIMDAGKWVQDGSKWYYVDASGAMKTGWLKKDGSWYYLESDGALAVSRVIDGYKVDASGRWVK